MFHMKQPLGGTSGSGFSTFASERAKRSKPSSLSSLPEEQQHRQLLHDPHQPLRQQHQQQQLRHPLEQESHPLNQRHVYFRSSAEQLATRGLGYPAGCGQNYPVSKDTYFTVDRTRAEGPQRMREAPVACRTFQTFGPQYQHTHPAWRRAKGLDGGRRFLSPTTSYGTNTTPNTTATIDDDDLTTTSGSYTISPDDPQTDAEEATFPTQPRDVMV